MKEPICWLHNIGVQRKVLMELKITGDDLALQVLKSYITYNKHQIIPMLIDSYNTTEETARAMVEELKFKIS